ncbi:hypothetical protein LH464_17255 [Neorhizobium sp. T786]|uniref:hypothetical protein n=1 Tax=Pseudorhizobium xiangyangii TaxID=2883104 RepID=UPI001CFF7E5E|nr:hypothetical protein [Neorhizobium xiangyangii]MCB5204216.1 hypothetical protein [Neorhizobium xiangyangii]
MFNPYSEEERLQAMISACFRASRSHFSHLPLRFIIDPPTDMLDAKLARQVAVHVLNVEFDIPRRRLVSLLGVARWTVMQAVRTVDYRCEEPCFERTYRAISARAQDLFMTALHDAAEEAA